MSRSNLKCWCCEDSEDLCWISLSLLFVFSYLLLFIMFLWTRFLIRLVKLVFLLEITKIEMVYVFCLWFAIFSLVYPSLLFILKPLSTPSVPFWCHHRVTWGNHTNKNNFRWSNYFPQMSWYLNLANNFRWSNYCNTIQANKNNIHKKNIVALNLKQMSYSKINHIATHKSHF